MNRELEHAQGFLTKLLQLSKDIECYPDPPQHPAHMNPDSLHRPLSQSQKVYWEYRQLLQSVNKVFPDEQCKGLLEDLVYTKLSVNWIRDNLIVLLQDIQQQRVIPSCAMAECLQQDPDIIRECIESIRNPKISSAMGGKRNETQVSESEPGTSRSLQEDGTKNGEEMELQAELSVFGLGIKPRLACSLSETNSVAVQPQVSADTHIEGEFSQPCRGHEGRELEAERAAIGGPSVENHASRYIDKLNASDPEMARDRGLIENHRRDPFVPPIEEDESGSDDSPGSPSWEDLLK